MSRVFEHLVASSLVGHRSLEPPGTIVQILTPLALHEFILPHWGLTAIECRLAHLGGALDYRRRVRTQLKIVRTDARNTPLRRGLQALWEPLLRPGRQGRAEHEPLIGSQTVADLPLIGLLLTPVELNPVSLASGRLCWPAQSTHAAAAMPIISRLVQVVWCSLTSIRVLQPFAKVFRRC
jgi:hypothetical protein